MCNYENKIIPAIRSRCANFRFSNIKLEHIQFKLNEIIVSENIQDKYNSNIIETIALLSKGDLRRSINLLQIISMQPNKIDTNLCYYYAGNPTPTETNNIMNILLEKNLNFNTTYNKIINIIKYNGYSLSIVIKELTLLLLQKSNIIKIISELADLENILTSSTFDDIYISSLISIFINNS